MTIEEGDINELNKDLEAKTDIKQEETVESFESGQEKINEELRIKEENMIAMGKIAQNEIKEGEPINLNRLARLENGIIMDYDSKKNSIQIQDERLGQDYNFNIKESICDRLISNPEDPSKDKFFSVLDGKLFVYDGKYRDKLLDKAIKNNPERLEDIRRQIELAKASGNPFPEPLQYIEDKFFKDKKIGEERISENLDKNVKEFNDAQKKIIEDFDKMLEIYPNVDLLTDEEKQELRDKLSSNVRKFNDEDAIEMLLAKNNLELIKKVKEKRKSDNTKDKEKEIVSKCAKCGSNNLSSYNFCAQCGNKLK